jgi:FtsP/CotA-like multicopper oxidase with cupredoxin domain
VPGNVALTNANLDGTTTPIAGFTGVDKPHYLGPTIVATKDRPVRILFRNLLPTGVAGDLFLPVDTTVMGSGMGPNMAMGNPPRMMEEMDPQNPMCGTGYDAQGNRVAKNPDCYAENRATLHLHGGITPWISDGTPHQWTTPAGENTSYPQGVSVVNVPDMPNPGPGAMTFFYTNQQSARLMFYHDHAWGITRLNVYAGEAAAYVITDDTEKGLISSGTLPPAADTIPLVVQDKTFVPSTQQLMDTDPLWDANRWGGFGNLWLPHVYVPAQNPGDPTGTNAFGRWAYGPWFWPPAQAIDHGPIDNPYYDPFCVPDENAGVWCEPPLMPGVPFLSMGMEAFHDTPLVNGTAYPVLEVQPKAYRFRVLNAANDRFFNLSLYRADPAAPTEVQLNPAEVAAALDDQTIFPTPLAGTEGPSWIQFGTEGGFLPAPVVIPAQPTTWVNDPTVFNAGNVDQHSLLLGPAERADVVVDFSAFAGQTLILYNDAPAAFPARDPRYDYYTGNADLTATGGAPSTLPGYGPNTRTVMQIKVAAAPVAPAFDLAKLQTAFKSKRLGGGGVFESGQQPVIVAQQAYNSAYGTSFNSMDGLAQIFDTSLRFKNVLGNTITIPLQPKMIQDEMGEAFEHAYGRMSGNLGVEAPNAQAGLQNMILYAYPAPPTEVIAPVDPALSATPIATADDGTQIWKVTHNGVDTHPIHFHLFDVQLLNRVGWDGIIRKPDANELGWKDTVRISPLEDTIVALRPHMPTNMPFDLPNSVRLIDPSMPEGAILASSTQADANGLPMLTFAPNGEPIDIVNHRVNFGHEYVWHCHILSHEEMDMMRPIAVAVAPRAPTNLVARRTSTSVVLTWNDNSLGETSFVVQRSTDAAFTSPIVQATLPANARTYTHVVPSNQTFHYRVLAVNTVGDTAEYADPAINELTPGVPAFPVKTATSSTTGLIPLPTTATRATAVTLSASAPSPHPTGTPVTFTATATSTAPVNYLYNLYLGGTRVVTGQWTSSSTWTMPANQAPGRYTVQVLVRTSLNVGQDASFNLPYEVTAAVVAPATAVSLSASAPSPHLTGTSVLFTATATASAPVQYQFNLWAGNTKVATQNWSSNRTWTMPANQAPGKYTVQVLARTTTTVNYDVFFNLPYEVTAPPIVPATAVSLGASAPSPHTNTTPVTFTATATASSPVEYLFNLWQGNNRVATQGYSPTATWIMPAGQAPGTYTVQVLARTSPMVGYDVFFNLPYVVNP